MKGARALLAKYFGRTPLVHVHHLDSDQSAVYVKNETVLPTGSFKIRGALYALSSKLGGGQVPEVVAASTGNHGAAVAFAARELGVPARIFLPERSNPVKAARIRDLGATLVAVGHDLSIAIEEAQSYVAGSGALFLHDASDPDIPAGTATIGAEILEQLPSVDEVYVPMGDTALIRGVASALRPADHPIRIIGVVAEKAPAYYLSWKSGTVVETATAQTIADGLAVRRPLGPNVEAIRELVDDVMTVSEREMLDAIALLRAATAILAEPSGAAALAALLRRSGGLKPADNGRPLSCLALVTGGNISPEVLKNLE